MATLIFSIFATKYKTMAKIDFNLSKKTNDAQLSEVLIRFVPCRGLNLRAKSGVWISPKHFRYFVDREATKKAGISIPDKVTSVTVEEAKEHGYILRTSGEIVFLERFMTPQLLGEMKEAAKLEQLKIAIAQAYTETDKAEIDSQWLTRVIKKFHNPNIFIEKTNWKEKSIYELIEEYIERKNFSDFHAKAIRVLSRDLARFEAFKNKVLRQDFKWKVWEIHKEDIEEFESFLRNEALIAKDYPMQYAPILCNYPPEIGGKHVKLKLEVRGENTIIKLKKKLKAFFQWLHETGRIENQPFKGIKIGSEKYGTPFYLTKEERNAIAEANLQSLWLQHDEEFRKRLPVTDFTALSIQRDIFVFQCLVGCRVGDYYRLTKNNISNGILEYVPHKTEDEDAPVKPRIPLNEHALKLVEKYKGKDPKGRLFPFISSQKYNIAIKKICEICDITRIVQVRNPKTGETESRRICDLASSHMARRTFVGAAYKAVKDPNIVGKMSGHVEGSRAFARYREIDDEILKETISKI